MTDIITNDAPQWLNMESVVNADHTITGSSGRMVMYSGLTAPRNLTLPLITKGMQSIMVMDEDGSCNLTNYITILPSGTNTLEGSTSRLLNYPYGTITIEAGSNGTWIVTANPNPSLSTGMQVKPPFTDNGNGTVTLGPGLFAVYTNTSGIGKIKRFWLTGGLLSLTDGVTNYIVCNYNAGSPAIQVITDVTQINETTIIPVYSTYRMGTTLYEFEWDQLGDAKVDKIHKSIVRTQRYRTEPGGLGLGEAATRLVTVGSGTVWTGAVPTALAAFNSSVNPMIFCYHTAGVWTFSTVTQYNNTQYDDGTNLQTLNPNRYAVNFIYRGVGVDTDCFYVLGNGNLQLGAAQVAQPPGNLPQLITSHCILVGRIIVQQAATTATQIDSAFVTQFTPTAATDHNSLANLQGGTASEYFHLTSAEYTGTGTGVFARSVSPALTGTPTVPTAPLGTNTTQTASTAFVLANAVTYPVSVAGWLHDDGAGNHAWTTPTYSQVGAPSSTGTGASGTWGISISGNAATVTSITSGQVTTALGFTPINKAGDTGIGALAISSATASTSPTTGSLVTAGGLGVAGAAWVGGDVVISKSDARLTLNGTASGGTGTGLLLESDTGLAGYLWNYANAALTLGTNNTSRITIRNSGEVSVFSNAASTSTTTGALVVVGGFGCGGAAYFGGGVTALQFKLAALNTTPASASDTGTLGEIRYDANYIYLCTATNTWKRSALTTW